MLGALLLAARLLLEAPLASELVGGEWLRQVCVRESACPFGLVGVHEGDRGHERTLGVGWSTRGPHGMMARHSWVHVPWWLQWAGPGVLDIPAVSAFVALRRARAPRCAQVRACRAWRGRSWLGVG